MFLNLFPNFVVCGTRLVAVAAQKFIADITDIAVTYYTLHCSFAGYFALEPLGFTQHQEELKHDHQEAPPQQQVACPYPPPSPSAPNPFY